MNTKFLVGLVTGVVASGIIAVNAGQKPITIESCASLLPNGHNFEVSITGSIDTRVNQRVFKGQLGLSDGTEQENSELQQAAKPFLICVASLLK